MTMLDREIDLQTYINIQIYMVLKKTFMKDTGEEWIEEKGTKSPVYSSHNISHSSPPPSWQHDIL